MILFTRHSHTHREPWNTFYNLHQKLRKGSFNFMHSVKSALVWVNYWLSLSPSSDQPNFCTCVSYVQQHKNIDVTRHKLSNSQTRESHPRLSVPPYLRCGKWRTGWCSEGGRDTGDNGKNISSSSPVLANGCRALRCGLHIRTAAADSQPQKIRGGSERRRGE